MNIKNIETIKANKVWDEITNNKHFLATKTIKTSNSSYRFYCLWLYFNSKIDDKLLNKWFDVCYEVAHNGKFSEAIDRHGILQTYGMKCLLLS